MKKKQKMFKIKFMQSILKRETVLQAIEDVLDERKNFEFNILNKVLKKDQNYEEENFLNYKEKWMNKNILTENLQEKVKVMNELLQQQKNQKLDQIRQKIQKNQEKLDETKKDVIKREEKLKDMQENNNDVLFNNFKPSQIRKTDQKNTKNIDQKILQKAKQNIQILPEILKQLQSSTKEEKQKKYQTYIHEKQIIQQLNIESVKVARYIIYITMRRLYQHIENKQQKLSQIKYYQDNLLNKRQLILDKKNQQEKKLVIKQINDFFIDSFTQKQSEQIAKEILQKFIYAELDTHTIIHKAINDQTEKNMTKKQYLQLQSLINKEMKQQKTQKILNKFEETIFIKKKKKKVSKIHQNFFKDFDIYYEQKNEEIKEECKIF